VKKFLPAILIALFINQMPAFAVPKSVAAVEITKVSSIAEHEGALITPQAITIFNNLDRKVAITSLDFSGVPKWALTLDGSPDQIAMAAAAEKDGSIWLAGLSTATPVSESVSATVPATNVDGVVVEPVPPLRNDLNAITLWKISVAGQLEKTFVDSATAPTLITALSHSTSGISILADRGSGNFIINISATGKFSTTKPLGSAKTAFNAIYRNSDGSVNLYGSSSENLAGKKLVGVRDGILAKVNKSGVITNLVRSSANRATRSWTGSTSTIFLVGDVKAGGKNESAFTKFNSSFSPTWTLRLPSQGAQLAAPAANGGHYALFNSTSSIPGVTGWKPTRATPIALRFDSKGVITQALKSSQVKAAEAMSFVPGVGLVIVSQTGIFKG
jgi:hypothetical protein